MTLSVNEMLRTKATFMCLQSVLVQARSLGLTGSVKIEWNAADARLEEWVKREILPKEILQNSIGFLILQDGEVVGAKIGDGRADIDDSLNTLIQMCYGIGCGVLPSTILTLCESEVPKSDVIGTVNDFGIMSRLFDIENAVEALQYA